MAPRRGFVPICFTDERPGGKAIPNKTGAKESRPEEASRKSKFQGKAFGITREHYIFLLLVALTVTLRNMSFTISPWPQTRQQRTGSSSRLLTTSLHLTDSLHFPPCSWLGTECGKEDGDWCTPARFPRLSNRI